MADAHRSVTQTLRDRVVRYVEVTWGQLPYYNDAAVKAFAAKVVPVVTAGQAQMASVTDAYLSQLVEAAGLKAGGPNDPLRFTGKGVRSVDPLEEYTRPGVAVWEALASDVPLVEAIARGLRRAQSLVTTDLQLSATHAAQARLGGVDGVIGYRRVLTHGPCCGLCVVASTQRYHKSDLMPIHPGCHCGVAPIFGTEDPGQVIDQSTLDTSHQALRDQFGPDVDVNDPAALRSQVVVHQHGEYGPTLAVSGQHFTGPGEIP
jgi:hypothetical protein